MKTENGLLFAVSLLILVFIVRQYHAEHAGPKTEKKLYNHGTVQKKTTPTALWLPETYRSMSILGAGYYGADYSIDVGERCPWISLRATDGTIHILRYEDERWYVVSFARTDLPKNVQTVIPLGAGYYGTDGHVSKNYRSIWISFRLKGGKALIYRYENEQWYQVTIN